MDRSIPLGAGLLLDFIGDIEAPRGYGTVYGNNQDKLPKPLTSMSIDEVIKAQGGWSKRFGSSASGRYQFMRATLTELKEELGLSGSQKLSPGLQDRLGYHLLKRRGYAKFMVGDMSRTEFGKRLAQEWASLPVLAAGKGAKRQVKRGQSYYAGDGLNKSLVKPDRVEAVLDKVLAAETESPERNVAVAPLVPRATVKRAAEIARKEMIEDVQEALRATGFPEVGNVDGRMGQRTRTAILAYRSVRALPLSQQIDDELLADFQQAVADGWTRPISEERATATVDDLQGSAVIQRTEKAKEHAVEADQTLGFMDKVLKWLGIGGTAAAGGYELVNPDQTEERLGLLQRLTSFIADNPLVLLPVAAVIIGIIYTAWARKRVARSYDRVDAAQRAEVIGYREGRHV